MDGKFFSNLSTRWCRWRIFETALLLSTLLILPSFFTKLFPPSVLQSSLALLTVFLVILSIVHRRMLTRERSKAVLERAKAFESVEAELWRSHKFLDSIVQNIPHMIFVKEASDLRFVRFNKAGEQLLGIPQEEMVGKNDYDFFPKEEADFFTAKDRRVLNEGLLVDIPEEPIHTKNNGIRILHTKKIPILDDKGAPRYLLGISEDVTELKKSNEMLFQKEVELTRAQIEREQSELFAHVVSHDLQDPLQRIIAFGDLLLKENGNSLDSSGLDYLRRMRNASERMSQLIEDLMRFSRATRQITPVEPVDLNQVLRDVLEDLGQRIQRSKANIQIGDLPTILASQTQMHELFQNLIGNAIKYSNKDTAPNIGVSMERGEDSFFVDIVDDGIGFDPRYRERIFHPFERIRSQGEFDGSGMGLAICQKIVSRLGGSIIADSAPGKGATFRLTFPKSIMASKVAVEGPHGS